MHIGNITGDGTWKYSKIDKAHNVCINVLTHVVNVVSINSLVVMQLHGHLQLTPAL